MYIPDIPPIVMVVAPLLLLAIAITQLTRRMRTPHQKRPSRTATIVLTQTPGNQSPRAYAHATAILSSNLTDVVIFMSEKPPPPPHPSIHFIPIIAPPPHSAPRRTLWSLALKLIALARSVLTSLCRTADLPFTITHIILNSPPVLPTLPIVALTRPFLFPAARLTLDCHNLAFTLMRLTSPTLVVNLAALAEAFSIRLAHNHWTVSAALSTYLRRHFGVRAAVVYDRPQQTPAHASDPARPLCIPRMLRDYATVIASETHPARLDVVASMPIVVTSTSWTPDEDFSILQAALPALDALHTPLLLVLTGKGPLRSEFENTVRALELRYVTVAFAWLPMDDYPRLLAHASLGICLHASSSGLDLPMKAVDLLAAGTPVLALRYNCIDELVVDDHTGYLFDNAATLVKLMDELLFRNPQVLKRLEEGVRQAVNDGSDWLTCWQQNALPTLRTVSSSTSQRPP